jgi:hypothetical protein
MKISRSLLLRIRNVSFKICRENENTYFMFNILFFRKSCRLQDNMGKYCTAGQVTDDRIIGRKRFACWIKRAIGTHSEHVILLASHDNNGYRNTPLFHVIRTLPVLIFVKDTDCLLCEVGTELLCLSCGNVSLEIIADHNTCQWRAMHWSSSSEVQRSYRNRCTAEVSRGSHTQADAVYLSVSSPALFVRHTY